MEIRRHFGTLVSRALLRAWLVASATLSACGDGGTSPTPSALVGTWTLVSVDGIQAPAGTLMWTITGTTIASNADNGDCIEAGTYTVDGNRITTQIVSVSGGGCGGEVGDVFTFTYSVAGDTLTVVVTDPDLGSATLIFRRG
ncbi:MAG TPA: lipocalin family protein [Gemmatimonadaceae bacterium]|nr:lipocalin family protein [Gemmatimonadaceae bacterium]